MNASDNTADLSLTTINFTTLVSEDGHALACSDPSRPKCDILLKIFKSSNASEEDRRRETKSSTSSCNSPLVHMAKKQNSGEEMAANAAITSVTDLNEAMHKTSVLIESEQLSLQNLWKLLLHIEKNTTSLLAENASLKASLEFIQKQHTALKMQNRKLEARVLTLEQQYVSATLKNGYTFLCTSRTYSQCML